MNLGEAIKNGNTAKIYLYDNKIIKIFNDNLPDTESAYEANKQKYAYSCGLPVPHIYEVTKINGKQAIIMEYIPGRTIGEIIYDDMSKAEEYMVLAVDLQLKIHEVKSKNLESMIDKLSRQIISAHLIDTKQKKVLLEKLYTLKYDNYNYLCHGDYHVFNLILNSNNNDIIIIDWVDSTAGNIRLDVYRSYLLYSQFSMNLADLYLRIYCEKSGLCQDEIFIWAPVVAGARLSENISTEKAKCLIDIVNRYHPL
jgi:tRNA A-37 threonylcarbamoyl transferase component Bud32